MKKPKTIYIAAFFFILMLLNIAYASFSDINGFYINGTEVNIPVELLILNAFMVGFVLNILTGVVRERFTK